IDEHHTHALSRVCGRGRGALRGVARTAAGSRRPGAGGYRLRRREPLGRGPGGLASDGATIWVANRESNDVTKLRASDGAVVGTFRAGLRPIGIAAQN